MSVDAAALLKRMEAFAETLVKDAPIPKGMPINWDAHLSDPMERQRINEPLYQAYVATIEMMRWLKSGIVTPEAMEVMFTQHKRTIALSKYSSKRTQGATPYERAYNRARMGY